MRRVHFVCVLVLCGFSLLHAKDLADYRVGDVADQDITTPVALDVIDPDATAARQTEEALKTPVIFRRRPAAAGQVEKDFRATFAAARLNFLTALTNTFHQPTLDAATMASTDFASFVIAFDDQNRNFPVTADLAVRWATGDAGTAIENQLLEKLHRLMAQPVRPDDLPKGLVLGDTARLAPATQKLTLEEAERDGRLVPQRNIVTLSQLRERLRKEFPQAQQFVARALAAFLKPNCAVDETLTQQARARQTARLAVIAHYDAGQVVVRRGQTIDAKTLAALEQLYAKTAPAQLSQQIAAEREQAQQAQAQARHDRDRAQQASDLAQREQEQARQAGEQAQQARAAAQNEHDRALKMRAQAFNAQSQALAVRVRNEWLAAALAGVSALALLMLFWLARQRRRVARLPTQGATAAVEIAEKNPPALPSQLAPYLAQALKEVVVQELAAQRGALLQVQQSAAAEIAELVHRLDQLQSPIHDRLRSYEMRIAELEKDLVERTEENRELLKIKIEMLRRQLESERARDRVEFN
jgi:7TM-HD extracellular